MRTAPRNQLTDRYRHVPGPGTVRDASFEKSAATVLQLVLAENRGDCMSLGLFTHYVSSFSGCPDGPKLRAEVIGELAAALQAGLLTVGDMIGSSHRPWTDAPAAIIAWIEAVWPDDTLPFSFETLQNICWLGNTPAGDRAAEVSRDLPA